MDASTSVLYRISATFLLKWIIFKYKSHKDKFKAQM